MAARIGRRVPTAIVAEAAALQAELAYSAARSDIEVTAVAVRSARRGGSQWYETRIASTRGDEDQAWVDRAVRYLDLCGLLRRDPKKPTVVRVLNREPRG